MADESWPKKGFTQLELSDLLNETDYWMYHFTKAQADGVMDRGVQAALFPMLVEVVSEKQDVINRMLDALKAIKIRVCFIGHPYEKTDEYGRPFFEKELNLLEAAIRLVEEGQP